MLIFTESSDQLLRNYKRLHQVLRSLNMHFITMWLQSLLLSKVPFLRTEDKMKAERSVLFSHLKSHKKSICSLSRRYDEQVDILKNNVGKLLSKLVLIWSRNVLHYSNTQQFPTKNQKLFQLNKFKTPTFDVSLLSQLLTYLALISIYKVWNIVFIIASLIRVD